jgi:hypothetical protein
VVRKFDRNGVAASSKDRVKMAFLPQRRRKVVRVLDVELFAILAEDEKTVRHCVLGDFIPDHHPRHRAHDAVGVVDGQCPLDLGKTLQMLVDMLPGPFALAFHGNQFAVVDD